MPRVKKWVAKVEGERTLFEGTVGGSDCIYAAMRALEHARTRFPRLLAEDNLLISIEPLPEPSHDND